MRWQIERENDTGGMDVKECATYQEALDSLAEMYGLPSSAWGPQLSMVVETANFERRVVCGASYPDGRDIVGQPKTFLLWFK